MRRAAILIACFFGLAVQAQAATRYVSTTGSDTATCTQTAPCKTFARAYTVATAGDTIEVAAGSYVAQALAANTKAVTFKGGPDVVVSSIVTSAQNVTWDGINVNVGNKQVLGVQFGGANRTD